jgi:hypothetical protein
LIDLIGQHQSSKSNTGSFFYQTIKHENRYICKYLQIFGVLAAFFGRQMWCFGVPTRPSELTPDDASAPHQPQHQPPDRDKQSIATPTTMPPRPTKKRARSSINPTTSSKRLRISLTLTPPITPSQSWEQEQLKSQPQELLAPPTEGSHAGTGSVATTEVAEDGYIDNGGDDFTRLDWDCLRQR